MELGRVGVWTSALGLQPADEVRRTARAVEEAGFRTVWYPEGVGTNEAMSLGAMLLGWTDQLIVASGIANIYARDATAMANGARSLAEAFPGRFLLGIGVSHAPSVAKRGGVYRAPIETMGRYLDAMDVAGYRASPAGAMPCVLAALGPRMLRLAAERTLGAHPYFVPVEHTRRARETMGEGSLLLTEQAVVLESDASSARARSRSHMQVYFGLDNYRNNLLRLGWPEDDLADGGSDAIVDAIVAWGDVEAIVGRVHEHLEAGADHVCIQILGDSAAEFRLDELRELAPALLEL